MKQTKRDRWYRLLGLDGWESRAYVGRVNVTLDNVEDRNVARRLAWYGGNHPVFGLQETAHHVQHSRPPDWLGLIR